MSQTQTKIEDSVDLRELFFSLLSQWKLIITCIIVSVIFALLYLRTTTDTYSVNAMVQVEDNKGASAALLGDLSSVIDQKAPAQTEIEIIKSRLILGQAIRDLNLDVAITSKDDTFKNKLLEDIDFKTLYFKDRVEFHSSSKYLTIRRFEVPDYLLDQQFDLIINDDIFHLIDQSSLKSYKGKFNQLNEWTTENGVIRLNIDNKLKINGEFELTKQSLPASVNQLSNNLSVAEKGKLTGIIGLNYEGTDKQQITQILNTILNAYTHQNIARRNAETQQTLEFLKDQLPQLKNDLEVSEKKFNIFRQNNNTINIDKESELLLTQTISFETKKVELEQQKAELTAKYTPDHPQMMEINAQLQNINTRLKSLNTDLKKLPEIQRQYLQLFRDVQVNTQLYTSLLNNYQQLKVANAGEIGNVRVIDYAVEPIKPIKPKKIIILILSLLLGGFIGVSIALLRNLTRTGIKDSADIEQNFELPVYATIPRSQFQPIKGLGKKKRLPLLAKTHSDDTAIESLRSVRTALHFALAKAKSKIILIAGPAPEVGKSFVSANLAAVLSQSDKRVLLIDGDMRRGYLHKYINQKNQPGLSELITGQYKLEDVIQKSSLDSLDFISRGKSPQNPAELLNSDNFKTLLDDLSQQYDHILIDSPPILAVTDGGIISQYAGVILIVARYGKTQMKELDLTVQRLEQAGIQTTGFIINDVQRGSGSYGYGYNYNYNYQSHKKDDE